MFTDYGKNSYLTKNFDFDSHYAPVEKLFNSISEPIFEGFKIKFPELFTITQENNSFKISEDENNYYAKLVIPGLSKENFTVIITKENSYNILSVKVSVKNESDKEYITNKMLYKLNLGKNEIDDKSFKAKYQAGVLIITIPKCSLQEKVEKYEKHISIE